MEDRDTMRREKTDEAETRAGKRLASLDLVSAAAIFCFGLFVLLSGIHMCFFTASGAKVWYYSPGFFPLFIGAVLMFTSLLMGILKLRAGARLGKDAFRAEDADGGKKRRLRLLLAIALFAVYVFVLIGTVPFVPATFAYLAVTMIVFREKAYPIWKLLLISAVTTGAVYLVFAVLASVPLP